ncbi:unnamed protein product [Closterium sp. Naga37s-1]|nr:unnamed protein product [Closterium sp. Naga37s-1]
MCGTRTAPTPAAAPSTPTTRQGFIIEIAVGAAALLLLGALGLYLWFRCSSRGKSEAPPIPSQILMCRRYSLDQVKKATGGWAEANHIGTGGYGEVYKGVCPFDDSVVWAVKRAKILTNDFKREVEEMATKSHPHLVRLLGYCVDMDMTTEHHEQIVIYEFCANGDLEKYLHGGAREQQRMDVLVGWHHHPRVSEFGLVRMKESHLPLFLLFSTSPPPTSQSYGVLLLEVITLKPVILSINGGQFNIKDWVRPFMEESKVAAFKDPLLPEASDDLILTLAKIGLQCTALPASSRPSMSEISRQLDTLRKDYFRRSSMDGDGPDSADVDQRLAKIDQELDRRAESGLSIQAEFVRLNIMSESGEYIKETEISAATGGYSNRSSGVMLLQSQEISQEFCQEIPSGR